MIINENFIQLPRGSFFMCSDDIDNFDIVSDTRVLHIDVKSSH